MWHPRRAKILFTAPRKSAVTLLFTYFFTFSFCTHCASFPRFISIFPFLPSFSHTFSLSLTSFLPCVFVSVKLFALNIQHRKSSTIWPKNKVSGAELNQFKKVRPGIWWLLVCSSRWPPEDRKDLSGPGPFHWGSWIKSDEEKHRSFAFRI